MATAGMVKPKIFPTVGAVAALPTVTISVEELQRQVDMRALRSRKSKPRLRPLDRPRWLNDGSIGGEQLTRELPGAFA